ncbi:hypothetical protein ACFL6I_28105 [candidate division KSB1 bacterium]
MSKALVIVHADEPFLEDHAAYEYMKSNLVEEVESTLAEGMLVVCIDTDRSKINPKFKRRLPPYLEEHWNYIRQISPIVQPDFEYDSQFFMAKKYLCAQGVQQAKVGGLHFNGCVLTMHEWLSGTKDFQSNDFYHFCDKIRTDAEIVDDILSARIHSTILGRATNVFRMLDKETERRTESEILTYAKSIQAELTKEDFQKFYKFRDG